MVCSDMTMFGQDTTIWKSAIWVQKRVQKKISIFDQITFVLMVVQIKFLALHITNIFF